MPRIEISPAAKGRIKEIRHYTKRLWGKEQADKYLDGMEKAMLKLPGQRRHWRPVDDDALKGIFFIRCEHHYIFFRELADHNIGILSVLHESMDMPSRLKDDSNKIARRPE